MQLPTLPSQVTQKRHPDGQTQQSLDNIVTPLNVVLQFLRGVFTYAAGLLSLTVDNLTVNVKATIGQLVATTFSATNATVTNLTATSETVGTLAVTGNETVGGTLQVSNGITRGSRFMGYRGFVESNAIAGTVANVGVRNVENSGGTIAGVNVFYQTPFAGSIAGFSIKVFNTVATAGSITITTTGATNNLNSAYTFTQVNANVYQTYTPGFFSYTANSQLNFLISSNAWAQAGGGIDLQVWFYE